MSAKQHNALSDTVYDLLYNQIVNGKLEPGQRITEMQIAQSHGISRAPVREALKRLSEDRLIALVPRSGCYVCKLSPAEARDILEIRRRLECLALEYAFDNLDHKKLRQLKEAFVACRELEDAKLVRRELQLDAQLHTLICESCNSEDLMIFLGKLWARTQLYRIQKTTEAERAQAALDAHVSILDAVLEGDRSKALELLDKHIDHAKKYAIE